jgi:hypothetical protein
MSVTKLIMVGVASWFLTIGQTLPRTGLWRPSMKKTSCLSFNDTISHNLLTRLFTTAYRRQNTPIRPGVQCYWWYCILIARYCRISLILPGGPRPAAVGSRLEALALSWWHAVCIYHLLSPHLNPSQPVLNLSESCALLPLLYVQQKSIQPTNCAQFSKISRNHLRRAVILFYKFCMKAPHFQTYSVQQHDLNCWEE